MQGFEVIYSNYFDDVYRYVYSLCRDSAIAEEITQDTFFKALKGIDAYKGECKIRVWLCQIAKNTYFTFLKKHQRTRPIEEAVEGQSLDAEAIYINREDSLELHKCIHKLEEPYKEVLMLRVFGELSFAKIGDIFGKTEGWARVTFHRTKMKIKENTRENSL